MNRVTKLVIVISTILLLSSVPSLEANSGGKHNQASSGCSCHSNGGGITATHDFPPEYTPGQTYSVNINLNGGTQAFSGGFNVVVNQGQLSNAGSGVQINGAGTSATHSTGGQLGWTFDWTAPSTGSGDVSVSIAVLQSNSNNMNSGDAWDNTQTIIPEFVVPNDPPSVANVDLIPINTANTTEDLMVIYQFSDPNGDQESGTLFHWYINGSRAMSFDGNDMISASSTSPEQRWKVEITPSDGTDMGTSVMSNEVTITDIDSDNDGYGDQVDAFPNDPNEHEDSDSDGVGDNSDAFPNDAAETMDSDSDGVGDNADAFPNDATETMDSDMDGVGDNTDAFPNDASETMDSDMDGVGDNADAFPNDASETMDSDNDGVGDNADVFPSDSTETQDTDLDGVGDNADAFPNDASETMDSDMDGVGDNTDAFPNDANETVDSDEDGVGDNSDVFPNDPNESADSDLDGLGDNADAFPEDASETVDSDMDGVGDNSDAFPNDANESADSDLDGVGDNADAFPNDASETMDTDGDGVGDNAQLAAEKAAAAAEDDESNNLTMIITVSVIVVIIAAALAMFMRRGSESEPVAVEKDFSQNLMAGQFRPFQPTMVEQHVEVAPQVVEPIVQAPMPVQQWTDESGHTWRTMDDGSTQWWNGTDWQNA